MALELDQPTQEPKVKTLKVLLYAPPGVGKTSLSLTAKNSLLLDFNQGAYRASVFSKAVISISDWEKALKNVKQKEDIQLFDTIVIDTVGDIVNQIINYLAKQEGIELTDVGTADQHKFRKKSVVFRSTGELSQNGWGRVGNIFRLFLNELNSYGKDLILIAHENELKDGEDTVLRPDILKGPYKIISRDFDLIGYMYMEGGKRILNFDPSEKFIGKNCIKLGRLEIPSDDQPAFHSYMANLISNVKLKLNERFDNTLLASQLHVELKQKIKVAERPEQFDSLATEIASIGFPHVIKMLRQALNERMTECNIKYDKELAKFRYITSDNVNKETARSKEIAKEKAGSSARNTVNKIKRNN